MFVLLSRADGGGKIVRDKPELVNDGWTLVSLTSVMSLDSVKHLLIPVDEVVITSSLTSSSLSLDNSMMDDEFLSGGFDDWTHDAPKCTSVSSVPLVTPLVTSFGYASIDAEHTSPDLSQRSIVETALELDLLLFDSRLCDLLRRRLLVLSVLSELLNDVPSRRRPPPPLLHLDLLLPELCWRLLRL